VPGFIGRNFSYECPLKLQVSSYCSTEFYILLVINSSNLPKVQKLKHISKIMEKEETFSL
jgi:hypothetical protein